MEKDWRCQKYGPLGWLEALIKLIAIGVGVASLSIYDNAKRQYPKTRIAQIALMCIIGAVYVALIIHRILDRELFALAFIVLQVIGHWIMVLITILSKDPGSFLFTYVFLMILSEYVKLMFLFLADNIEVRFLNKPILMGMSAGFIVVYLTVLGLQVGRWLTEYDT